MANLYGDTGNCVARFVKESRPTRLEDILATSKRCEKGWTCTPYTIYNSLQVYIGFLHDEEEAGAAPTSHTLDQGIVVGATICYAPVIYGLL